MGKLHDILELIRQIEVQEDGTNYAELQCKLDALISEALAEPGAKLITRDSLMQAIQFAYRKHVQAIEKKEDVARRGDIVGE
jgi:hypothetical protein